VTRTVAWALALLLLGAVLLALAVESATGAREPAAITAIRHEFGTGPLAGCMVAIAYRESRYQPRAANWTDRHADGSRGSFGVMQIGALWRRPGESVAHFAARMFNPYENVKLARQIYRRYGTGPWGGCG
jgi:hypothetical protein